MEFYIDESRNNKVSVKLYQESDSGDVNLCVNGNCVAWLSAEDNVLRYNTDWLKQEGLSVEQDNE